ncbi:mitogen-activated protein kinase kinase kinase a [Fagus crenata]
MQLLNSDQSATESIENSEKSEISKPSKPPKPSKPSLIEDGDGNAEDEAVLDVSGKSFEVSSLENSNDAVEGLYLYKNVFNLIPKSLGGLGRLRKLKFFGNEINLFPTEFGSLVGLECLQVKISSPSFGGLPLNKLESLKELELSKVPPRPSAFPILGEIAGLKCLTKLSVCHFSIRYLPPEIGCLNNLEYLDLSFNKMKSLPTEISYLNALISLKVANNKLVEIPSGLSSLQKLENLDLSNNRLTSIGALELDSMHNLQKLNLQFNKLLSCCQIPSWICCNLEGNGRDASNDDFISSSVAMDVYDTAMENERSLSCNDAGSCHTSSTHLTVSSSNSRCFAARRSGKRWKRRYYLQQKARQERLNNSRKWKGVDCDKVLTMKADENIKSGNLHVPATETCVEGASDIVVVDDDDDDKQIVSGETGSENLLSGAEDNEIDSIKGFCVEKCSSVSLDSATKRKGGENECCEPDISLDSTQNGAGEGDEDLSAETLKSISKSKRHCDRDLDNPKPCKSRKPIEDSSILSHKYSNNSFCSIEDHLSDGFYDAGRDRPFMSLSDYEQSLHLDSREVILVDRKRDEELDAITLSAQALVFHLKHLNGLSRNRDGDAVDVLQIASLLALFVSDHFGGSDRGAIVERTRKAVSGSNYQKPFVCTCSTGNSESIGTTNKAAVDTVEDIIFSDLCNKSISSIKVRRNSIIVPIGALQFGVCRHRALLMKYLCDRMEPPVPCELVRGYLDFLPHAWNVVPIKRGDTWVRMVVDACRPHDIREETDSEYFCRYLPLRRTQVPLSSESRLGADCSFPSLSCDEIEKTASSSLIRCKFGPVEAVAKVRTLEVCGASVDELSNFEYSCLGEVRILGALRHSCIVEMYGHQISSKWVSSVEGSPECRILKSAIFLEYIEGGSLKGYVEKLSKAGEKHVPVELALCIARDVACALAELHSKHIIHRDIKSENILIDLDRKRADGMPIVKLCDFDRAVPLRSFLHTCCLAHNGVPPPDVCVGTPRWMAPEVLQAMHKRNRYGLEVDIWSFGCLLLELLTLQVPFHGLSELHIHDLLQIGKRPQLTDELEALGSLSEPAMAQSDAELVESEAEVETLSFLVDLFRRCTEEDPKNRPTADDLYDMLVARTSNVASSRC